MERARRRDPSPSGPAGELVPSRGRPGSARRRGVPVRRGPAGHHDLLPDGCMDLVWTAGSASCCAVRTPRLVVRHARGRRDGRRALPAGRGRRRLRRRRDELVDRRVPLADLLGARRPGCWPTGWTTPPRVRRMAVLEELVRARQVDADPTIEMAGSSPGNRARPWTRSPSGRACRHGSSGGGSTGPSGTDRRSSPGSPGCSASPRALRVPGARARRAGRHRRVRRPVAPGQGRPGDRRAHAAGADRRARGSSLARRRPRWPIGTRRRPAGGARWAA